MVINISEEISATKFEIEQSDEDYVILCVCVLNKMLKGILSVPGGSL
jgi:hypothetical protein